MNDRDRFVACLLGRPVDRPPFWLYWRPWATTWTRWQNEGMPPQIQDRDDLAAFFGIDRRPAVTPVNCGPCPKIERTITAEDELSLTYIDPWGIKRRDLKGRESMSEFIAFPVQGRADWERFKAERLDPDHPERLSGDWCEQCARWMAAGVPIQLGNFPDVTIFGAVRWLLGDEAGLMAFYTMPDLVHEIMDHMTTLYLTVFEQVVGAVQVDVIHIWEDMCYRNGPLISPRHWEEFCGPHYRRIKAFAERRGIPLISVDTDGDPDRITPPMVRAGVNYLFPLEVAAGCEINAWQARYPSLGMMGGIDKRVLARGPAAIDRELDRIAPAVARGRYIPCLDHLVPDDVSWQNYAYYARALKRLVGKRD